MKKVLYVAHENTKGGATHSLINVLDYLPEHIQPYVLIPKTLSIRSYFSKEYRLLMNAGTLKQELHKRKIPYYEAFYFLDNINVKQNILRKFFFSLIRNRELNKIKKKIKNDNIQVIHSNSSVIRFGADLARICQLRHLWHIREDVKDVFNISEKNLKGYINNIIENAEKIIFVSEKLKLNFLRNVKNMCENNVHEKQIVKIYNGIPLFDYKGIISNVKDESFNIYCFGTVYEIKGQEDLIYLAKKMKDEGISQFSITLVGTKKQGYYEYLLTLIKKYQLENIVKFVDYTNDLDSLRADASVEVVSSRSEAFGRVAVEAMNFGNPLVATCVGGLQEIVEHKKTGLQYKPGDIEGLYQNIRLIMNGEIDLDELKKNARKKSKEFDIQKCVSEICKLY
ncbi:glycosyltransferase family 4 protein [Bacillus rhizoplanae]|uniref:glycosyltransferase family 4 protein n=1 Tax=Bacillus rhizoplanae TaxID=2880966 RepID=UPI003D24CD83